MVNQTATNTTTTKSNNIPLMFLFQQGQCEPRCISRCGTLVHLDDITSRNLTSCFKTDCQCSLPEESSKPDFPVSINFYTTYMRAELKALADPDFTRRTNVSEELRVARLESMQRLEGVIEPPVSHKFGLFSAAVCATVVACYLSRKNRKEN